MVYIYKSDRFEPEPLGAVAVVFATGALSVIPVALIEQGLSSMLGFEGEIDTLYEVVGSSWFVAGFVEEMAKFGVVLFAIYYAKEFDEPVDGIVYSSASALGFASLENFLYLNRYGTHVILVRGPLSTLAHLLFSSMWGYGLGRGKFHPRAAKRLALWGLVLAAAAHGTFNFLLMSEGVLGNATKIPLALGVLPFTFALWLVLRREIHRAEEESPFRKEGGR